MKEEKELEKELKASQAVQDREEKKEIVFFLKFHLSLICKQTETLKAVFLLYFHILRKRVKSKLLPTVLEGLSHFAHLINLGADLKI